MKEIIKKIFLALTFLLVFFLFFYFFLLLISHWQPIKKLPENPFFKKSEFLNIAHRGGKGIAPENTLYAFSNALKVGADVLEMDVHKTLDNVLVVIHDKSLDRTTDKVGLIQDMNLAEIKKANAGYSFHKNNQFIFRSQKIPIPTLEEVLRNFSQIRKVIEIKPIQEKEFISGQLLCNLLTKYEQLHLSLVVSFSNRVIENFLEICPKGQTISSLYNSLKFLILNQLNLISFYTPKHIAFEIPPAIFNGEAKIYSESFLQSANLFNISVHLWTINDEKEMEKFFQDGVQGILTDYPDRLHQIQSK